MFLPLAASASPTTRPNAACVARPSAEKAGGHRVAFMHSLIVTAKLNDIDPQAWLADVLARTPDMPISRLPELLP